LKSHADKIKGYGKNIRTNYLKIAKELYEIDKSECYLDDGFEDTQDFASKVLNIQKTTSYNLIRIGREFLSEDGSRTALTDKGNDYGVSQLQILLPLGVDKAKELHDEEIIKPEMSVRQLKTIVKHEIDPTEGEDDGDVVEIDGEITSEEVLNTLCKVEIFEDKSVLIECDESIKSLETIIRDAINSYFL
jgi:hypothetical protein